MQPKFDRRFLMLNYYKAKDIFVQPRQQLSSTSTTSTTTSASNTTSSSYPISYNALSTTTTNGTNLFASQVLLKQAHQQRVARKSADVTIPSSGFDNSTIGSGSGSYANVSSTSTSASSTNNSVKRYRSKNANLAVDSPLKGHFFMDGESFDEDTLLPPFPDVDVKLTRGADLHNLWQILQIKNEYLSAKYTNTYVTKTEINETVQDRRQAYIYVEIPWSSEDDPDDFYHYFEENLNKYFVRNRNQNTVPFLAVEDSHKARKLNSTVDQQTSMSLLVKARINHHDENNVLKIVNSIINYVNWFINTYIQMLQSEKLFRLLASYVRQPIVSETEFQATKVFMMNQYGASFANAFDNVSNTILASEEQMERHLRYRLALGVLQTDPISQFISNERVPIPHIYNSTQAARLENKGRLYYAEGDRRTDYRLDTYFDLAYHIHSGEIFITKYIPNEKKVLLFSLKPQIRDAPIAIINNAISYWTTSKLSHDYLVLHEINTATMQNLGTPF